LLQTRLAELTPEQRARLPGYVAPRSRINSTAADRALAEQAVAAVYAAGGLAPPERIVWSESPIGLAKDWLAQGDKRRVGANVRSLFTAAVDAARNKIFNAVVASVWDAAERGTANTAANTTALGVRNAVVAHVDRVRLGWSPNVRSWFGRGERRAGFRDSSWSLIDALDHNLPAYTYMGEVAGFGGDTRQVAALWTLSTTTGWIIPHERVCWLCDLPTNLSTETSGRLHSGKQAALEYADGWAVHVWKGVSVPDWVVTRPDLLTVRAIDRQANPWVRRCMVEILTPERYIALGGATCISRDSTGKLWRRQWWGPGDDTWAAVEVVNGSPEPDGSFKRYFLQVPATVRTAREAVAWTYGLTEAQYADLVIRT
jgi:hypothetical protein